MAEQSPVVKTLTLEQIEVNLFRGFNPAWGGPRIFGGQVIAQALMAAYSTVQDRFCHSLQCYFIRPGDTSLPVLYEVEQSRDGKSFTTRRVKAIQKGEQIFNLNCSFQVPEDGLEHQRDMPEAPPPETVPDENERLPPQMKDAPQFVQAMMRQRPIEMHPVNPLDENAPQKADPRALTWFRTRGDVNADDIPMNQAILAYASDFSLLSTSMRPHRVNWNMGRMQTASLDHVLWFHRPSHLSEWHLYEQISPSASGGRGMNLGYVYSREGKLVATVAQEGLIRMRKE